MSLPHRVVRPLFAACLGGWLVPWAAAQVSETVKLGIGPSPGQPFARVVAMWSDRAMVGAPGDYTAGTDAGAAFIPDRQPDGSWLTVATLTAGDAAPGDGFGSA